jgi:AcrR family transcriptional regulator
MPRISKNPEERKAELVDAAERMFFERGYEQTAVSDIVKSVNVAHGTFYYHFKSKDDILEAVINRYNTVIEKEMIRILQNDSRNAVQQFKDLIEMFLNFRVRRMNQQMVEYLHGEETAALHQRIAQRLIRSITPYIIHVANKGLSQGIFSFENLMETIEYIIGGALYLLDALKPDDDPARIERAVQTVLKASFRVLGVKEEATV